MIARVFLSANMSDIIPFDFLVFTLIKAVLTIEDFAAYSNIGVCKLHKLTKKPNCPLVLYIGKKNLVKRDKFEKYISDAIAI